jgi:four helix bundle protein
MNSYEELEIFRRGKSLFFDTYQISRNLPKFELYELGSQIRRASDSVVSNIVEGYGRRRYKAEFVRFLTFSHASSIEIIFHLEKIGKLYPELKKSSSELRFKYSELSKMIYKFTQFVEKNWKT